MEGTRRSAFARRSRKLSSTKPEYFSRRPGRRNEALYVCDEVVKRFGEHDAPVLVHMVGGRLVPKRRRAPGTEAAKRSARRF